jgi:hypothetical protein
LAKDRRNVFLNVPFDDDYVPLFDALVFTITACGFRVRCALEEDDSGDIRLDKLVKLIRESPRSIHDLSRTELGDNDLPRFNMPFELGLALGAKRFGGRPYRSNSIKMMVSEPYRLPAYLSDLGGNDPAAHRSDPHQIIGIVRDYLHNKPIGGILPGRASLIETFEAFRATMPDIAQAIRFRPSEINALTSYRTYLWCVAEFLASYGEDGI